MLNNRSRLLFIIAAIALAGPALARDKKQPVLKVAKPVVHSVHVWHSTVPAREAKQDQTVTIIGNKIDWGTGYWTGNLEFGGENLIYRSGGSNLAQAISDRQLTGIKMSEVCQNLFISDAARATTGQSDVTTRWLTAQEIYNSMVAKRIIGFYQQAIRIDLLVDRTSYKGFKVGYADGSHETWIITPNSSFSSVKLFDTPAPDSLTGGKEGAGCVGK